MVFTIIYFVSMIVCIFVGHLCMYLDIKKRGRYTAGDVIGKVLWILFVSIIPFVNTFFATMSFLTWSSSTEFISKTRYIKKD